MSKAFFSNSLLGIGTLMLIAFAVMELAGWHSDPILPALAALAISCTAILDRVGKGQPVK
jgi:hypothetical protein